MTIEANIAIEPYPAVIVEKIEVRVSGLHAGQSVRLQSRLTDDAGVGWIGEGCFIADGRGIVDVQEAPSSGGTYFGANGSGLFWSMLPDTGDNAISFRMANRHSAHQRGQPAFVDRKHISVTLTCLDLQDNIIGTREFIMHLQAPEIEVRPLRSGPLRGLIWGPDNEEAGKGVVFVFTGSNGGTDVNYAPRLATLGYRVISLAFFGYEDLSPYFSRVPLEYFVTGVEWAQEKYGVDQVVLMGGSRGGELTMLLAAHFPALIAGIVATVPMHVCLGGIDENGAETAPWTLRGDDIPFVERSSHHKRNENQTGTEICWRTYSDELIKDTEKTAGFEIPVELLQCPLLLISGEDDQIWDSSWGADRIVDRLRAYGSKIDFTHMRLYETGHWLLLPNQVTSLLGPMVDTETAQKYLIGGTPVGTARSSWMQWTALTGFLEKSFRSNTLEQMGGNRDGM